jgi:hypothetical protein
MLKTDEKNSIAHFYHGDNKKVWIATVNPVGCSMAKIINQLLIRTQ